MGGFIAQKMLLEKLIVILFSNAGVALAMWTAVVHLTVIGMMISLGPNRMRHEASGHEQ
ncbi:hypothetical protein AB7M18_002331 [Pseudomonas viridiflava]